MWENQVAKRTAFTCNIYSFSRQFQSDFEIGLQQVIHLLKRNMRIVSDIVQSSREENFKNGSFF